jgi:hypothetical protein
MKSGQNQHKNYFIMADQEKKLTGAKNKKKKFYGRYAKGMLL